MDATGAIQDGLYGYNGYLIGAGVVLFQADNNGEWNPYLVCATRLASYWLILCRSGSAACAGCAAVYDCAVCSDCAVGVSGQCGRQALGCLHLSIPHHDVDLAPGITEVL